jgi:hypothetical protein
MDCSFFNDHWIFVVYNFLLHSFFGGLLGGSQSNMLDWYIAVGKIVKCILDDISVLVTD